jgi:hypothetical protein
MPYTFLYLPSYSAFFVLSYSISGYLILLLCCPLLLSILQLLLLLRLSIHLLSLSPLFSYLLSPLYFLFIYSTSIFTALHATALIRHLHIRIAATTQPSSTLCSRFSLSLSLRSYSSTLLCLLFLAVLLCCILFSRTLYLQKLFSISNVLNGSLVIINSLFLQQSAISFSSAAKNCKYLSRYASLCKYFNSISFFPIQLCYLLFIFTLTLHRSICPVCITFTLRYQILQIQIHQVQIFHSCK